MKYFFSLPFLFFSFLIAAQSFSLPAEVRSSIEKRIEYEINPSIVVGVIDSNSTSYFNFGLERDGGTPVDEHSIYEIGSITKVFTGILLANAIVKGEMSADDPAQNYLPSSVTLPQYEGKSITLGNLSDHTSSLPRMPSNFAPADPLNPYADYSAQQLYDFLSSYELKREIGSQYEYSNLAVGLLGHILSLKYGKPYEELMLDIIAHPLHLEETKVTMDEHMKSNLAIGHANGIEVPNWDLSTLAGAGAIKSSTSDLLKFLEANMGLTSSALSPAMMITHAPRHNKAGGSSVGLGWHINESMKGPIVWHNGATGGYRAFIGFNQFQKLGVVVMTNADQEIDDIGFHLLDPDSPLREIKPGIIKQLKELIDEEGPKSLLKKFNKLKKEGKYDINEGEINSLGYWYMNDRKNLDAAAALFEINVAEFPSSSNVYDSYGEVLMNQGKKEEAIANYKKSLELNPGNTNAVDMLAKMGVQHEMKAIEISEDILKSYDGTYVLFPGFNLIITHEGTHLFGQATGQSQFELFATSNTEFYLKVTEARVVFKQDTEGKMGLTLFQGGQEMVGKKI